MSEVSGEIPTPPRPLPPDSYTTKLTKFALRITYGWLAVIGVYSAVRFDKIFLKEPNTLGDFLAGAFAPLAFFWLVVGYFLQRRELELQRHELEENRTVQSEQKVQMALQAEAIRANEQHARRDTFFRMIEFARHELAMRAAHLHANLRSSSLVKFEDAPDYLANEMNKYIQGDRDIFFRALPRHFAERDRFAQEVGARQAKGGTVDAGEAEVLKAAAKMGRAPEIRSSAATMLLLYDELLEAADKLGDDGALRAQLEDSSLGFCCGDLEKRFPSVRED